jgi:hypothetical protein
MAIDDGLLAGRPGVVATIVAASLSAGGVSSATSVGASPSDAWHDEQAVAPSGLLALQWGQFMLGVYIYGYQ